MSLPSLDGSSPAQLAIRMKARSLSPVPTTADESHPKHIAPLTDIPCQPYTADQPLQPAMTQRKKWALLAVFSLAFFLDCWGVAGMWIFSGPICRDLSIVVQQHSWVITSFAASFAAFLLFFGRVADTYSAKSVFVYGFVALGVSNLVLSFIVDRFSFLIIRAISGIAAAAVVPSAYRLIVIVFEPKELGKALALYGMSGGLANVLGNVGAGAIEMIPTSGQMAGWRWFFRITGILILPFALGSFYWIPTSPPSQNLPMTHKWKRLDLVGSFLILVAVILLLLGLTLGATDGWRTPQFLVPFLLSSITFPLFFLWERRLPFDLALLPPSVWRIPNFTTLIVSALYIYSWAGLTQLSFMGTYIGVYGDSAILAAGRMSPIGVSAVAVSLFLTIYPRYVDRPRWPIAIGMLGSIVGSVLYAVSNNGRGNDYWFVFAGNIIGAAGILAVLIATNVGVMTAVPPEMAGVAGAVLQVSMTVGQAAALSIQAGLYTVEEGNFANWLNVRLSFIVLAGWGVLWLVGFLVLYKPAKRGGVEKDGAE